ncbi:MAG: acetate/propionate family kinase [Candidatus Poribacteria bacterium]|nr:acetate/propionate family kinase [Candidatus Poribacteria bacterium]
MIICVWNTGSTALKFELIHLTGESLNARGKIEPFEQILAKGSIRRIGSRAAFLSFSCHSKRLEIRESRTNRARRIAAGADLLLQKLLDSQTIAALDEINACAFKTIHLQGADSVAGTVELTPSVLDRMGAYNGVAPAHNPAYLELIRACQARMPETPMIGAFEFEFHQTMPSHAFLYSIPHEWRQKWGIRRYGFHGASHQYIAERVSELYPDRTDLKVINAHLGGSSSLCAIRDGKSIDTSMGFSPQGAIPNATRNGDFDLFAGLWLIEREGVAPGQLREQLCKHGGLAGVSGIAGGNLPKIMREAAEGNVRCQETIDLLTYEICKTIGGYTVALDGLDVLTFTGGIGEHEVDIRQRICERLAFLGVKIDSRRNSKAHDEQELSPNDSRVPVWVIPTHEELIVARRALRVLESCGLGGQSK